MQKRYLTGKRKVCSVLMGKMVLADYLFTLLLRGKASVQLLNGYFPSPEKSCSLPEYKEKRVNLSFVRYTENKLPFKDLRMPHLRTVSIPQYSPLMDSKSLHF